MRKTEGERDSHKAKEGEEQALTTPLSYTGSPEELDAELGKHPAAYVDSHVQRGSNFGGSEDGNGNGAKEARQKPRTTQQPKTPDENGPKQEATVAMATATEAHRTGKGRRRGPDWVQPHSLICPGQVR